MSYIVCFADGDGLRPSWLAVDADLQVSQWNWSPELHEMAFGAPPLLYQPPVGVPNTVFVAPDVQCPGGLLVCVALRSKEAAALLKACPAL
jgi:hypothetical protein